MWVDVPGHAAFEARHQGAVRLRNRLQTANVVLHSLGLLLTVLGFVLLLPLAFAVLAGEFRQGYRTLLAFAVPSAASFVLGLGLKTLFRRGEPNGLQAMLICGVGWLACSALGGVAFVIGIGAAYLDGFFETMSGFTTTGITMFTGLDRMPRSILFWRSLTQWVGGLGILTFFLAVVYQSGSAHNLFGAESHKIETRRLVPGIAHTVRILWGIYAGFTVAVVAALALAGMSVFDGICHSFTALSTGGFSPYDESIGYYGRIAHPHYAWIEYILVVAMLIGGTNFLIHYRVLTGSPKAVYDNTEMRYWWGLIALFVGVVAAERMIRLNALAGVEFAGSGFWKEVESTFRGVLFQVVSIITTTGFGTRDIAGAYFGNVARQLFLVMMVVGGCVGSTGGGIKVLRVAILAKLMKREVYRVRVPLRAISTITLDGKPVEPNEVRRVSGLFFTWVVLLVVGGVVTAFLSDLGGYESFSGMFSALGNIGPCYITVPQMSQLHPLVKITYILGMLAGRLEILPVLLLFSPRAWRS